MPVKNLVCAGVPGCLSNKHTTHHAAPPLEDIFNACDADSSGQLDKDQVFFALKSYGLYPTQEVLETSLHSLGLLLPLDLPGLGKLIQHMAGTDSDVIPRGLCAVPYARRGITLGQLKAIADALLGSGWLQSLCDNFNEAHAEEIAAGSKFESSPNLYSIDKPFVQATTNPDASARKDIPTKVLKMANIPDAPELSCCFSQLLNPDGLVVDV